MKLTHCATVTSLQRSQRKSIRDSLKITIRTKSKHTKKNQKQYTKLNTDSVPKKTKKKPQYRLCTKTENITNPIVVVAVAKLACHRCRLTVAHHSSQREQIAVSPRRRSSQIDLLSSPPRPRPSQSPSGSPVLSSPPRPSQLPSESPVLIAVAKPPGIFSLFLSFSFSVSLKV